MLELLEKRGPKAFDNFVWILKENYEWLADMLEREYEKREQAAQYEKGNATVTVDAAVHWLKGCLDTVKAMLFSQTDPFHYPTFIGCGFF